MGRPGVRGHRWTDDDDAALREAIARCEPMLDHLREQPGASVADYWGAVAGQLFVARGVTVTGPACSRRVQTLRDREEAERQAAEAERARSDLTAADLEPYDAVWQAVGERVDAAGAELSDLTASARAYAQSAAEDARLCRRMLAEVCRQLGVDVSRWETEAP